MEKNEACSNTENVETAELTSEMALPVVDSSQYREYLDRQGEAKKRNYLLALQSHNRELIGEIRQLDKKLNVQVQAINKKILISKKRPSVPKIQVFQSSELRNKFQQMERLKRELEDKRAGMDSLQFLLSLKEKYALNISHLRNEIKIKNQSLGRFRKMHSKIMSAEERQQREVANIGETNLFSEQIGELKRKVREKNERIRKKKEEFFSLYRQNKSNRSILEVAVPEKKQEEDAELKALKQQYEAIGKRVNMLKAKKAKLLKATSDDDQNIRVLQRLKQKYQSLTKLVAK